MNGQRPVSGRFVLISVLAIVAFAACGGTTGPVGTLPARAAASPVAVSASPSTTPATASPASPSPLPTPAPSIPPKLHVNVYFSASGDAYGLIAVDREIDATPAVATAAMRELLAGPTAEERSGRYRGRAGRFTPLTTEIPTTAELLGVKIANRVATVNLSRAFRSGDIGPEAGPERPIAGDDVGSWAFRLAQVVYTLTQFPSVDRVRFQLDGKAAEAIEGHEATGIDAPGRDAYWDQLWPLMIEKPAWGGHPGTTTLRLAGRTLFPDGRFQVAVVDGATGRTLVQRNVRAACPSYGCMAPDAWGPFDVTIPLPAGPRPTDLRLRVTEPPVGEAREGAVRDYPLVP
jgi:germination protein M